MRRHIGTFAPRWDSSAGNDRGNRGEKPFKKFGSSRAYMARAYSFYGQGFGRQPCTDQANPASSEARKRRRDSATGIRNSMGSDLGLRLTPLVFEA